MMGKPWADSEAVPCWMRGKLIYLWARCKHIPYADIAVKCTHVEPMYCQSNEMLPAPSPSLPTVPPK